MQLRALDTPTPPAPRRLTPEEALAFVRDPANLPADEVERRRRQVVRRDDELSVVRGFALRGAFKPAPIIARPLVRARAPRPVRRVQKLTTGARGDPDLPHPLGAALPVGGAV